MNIKDIPKEVFKAGILDEEYHARLLADLERIAHRAGVPPSVVWSKLSDHLKGEELEWVRNLRKHSQQGIVYCGPRKTPIEDTMMAIAGVCLRNYIDVRFMPVQQVIAKLSAGDMPTPTVLLIPNFYIDKGGDLSSWNVPELLGLLYTRMANNMKTILYVSSMEGVNKDYGDPFKKHLEAHYVTF